MSANTVLENKEVTQTEPKGKRKLIYGTHINETEESIEIITEVAGYNKETLKITVESQELRIIGETAEEKAEKSKRVIQQNFSTAGYSKVFRISDKIDSENISAEVKNGVLRLNLPKIPRAQKRQIEVKASD